MARPPRIDRDTVLAATLALADDEGLDAVTMQRVAARLGVTAMALYRHVGTKADLLDGVVERMLGELPAPPARARTWQAQLVAMSEGLRAVARRHPSVFPLLLLRPAATPAARAVTSRVLDVLRAAGVPARDLARVERLISTLALGFAAGEAAGRIKGTPAALAAEYRALARFVLAGLEPFRRASR